MAATAVNLSLEQIEARLASHTPSRASRLLTPKRAAVAAVLRYRNDAVDGGDGPEVLLIKRSERPDDRWSGQVAMPGGREQDTDTALLQTAIRETREEVGVDLESSARLLGRLDATRAIAKGKLVPLSITPFVFVQTEPSAITLNHEATASFWLPLARAATGELDGVYPYQMGQVSLSLPSWEYDGQTVWGLTHRMLSGLLTLVGAG